VRWRPLRVTWTPVTACCRRRCAGRQAVADERGGVSGMERIAGGRAHCALCGEAIRAGEDALVTPDFIANESDPLWRFADAPMHRACFFVWARRKEFIARFNRLAQRMLAPDGSHPLMTSEGEIVRRPRRSPPAGGPAG